MSQIPLDTIINGDCLSVMKGFPDNSFDCVITDPPYGLAFMGKEWDSFRATRQTKNQFITNLGAGMRSQTRDELFNYQLWCEQWANELLRVMKPGAHLLAFGGTRTHHRMTCAIEDAGFEIRDCLMWVYGSGFPKSLDVSKAIDKAAGHERNTAEHKRVDREQWRFETATPSLPAATPAAQQWDGWGTALKPAYEPIILARKPLSEPTVAANVLRWGTGGINVDGCRIEGNSWARETGHKRDMRGGSFHAASEKPDIPLPFQYSHPSGRWPANILFDEEAAAMLDEQSGKLTSGDNPRRRNTDKTRECYSSFRGQECKQYRASNSGGASRFFYCAKASRRERNEGCEGMEEAPIKGRDAGQDTRDTPYKISIAPLRNHHPTVKPLALIRYLCRLITPPGGIILDPFIGSGTLGRSAWEEGFHFVGVEKEAEYCAIAERRIAAALSAPGLVTEN